MLILNENLKFASFHENQKIKQVGRGRGAIFYDTGILCKENFL